MELEKELQKEFFNFKKIMKILSHIRGTTHKFDKLIFRHYHYQFMIEYNKGILIIQCPASEIDMTYVKNFRLEKWEESKLSMIEEEEYLML